MDFDLYTLLYTEVYGTGREAGYTTLAVSIGGRFFRIEAKGKILSYIPSESIRSAVWLGQTNWAEFPAFKQ